jgi:hypothetical protein
MGGKGDEGGSNDDQMRAMNVRNIEAQQLAAKQGTQKEAAAEPVKDAAAAKETPVVDEKTQLAPEAVVPGSENLTGLGDAMVGGLKTGTEQIADQTARVGANPQTYGVPFDPYTGTYQGQGPYTGGSV